MNWSIDELAEAIAECARRREDYQRKLEQETAHQKTLYAMMREALIIPKPPMPQAFDP